MRSLVRGGVVLLTLALVASPVHAADGNPAVDAAAPRLKLNVSAAALAQPPLSQAEWQRQLDAAQEAKKSGKFKMILGGALVGGGVLLSALATNSCLNSSIYSTCSGSINTAMIGGLVDLGGSVSFVWGLVQFMGANGDIRTLEARRPSATSIDLTDHQSFQFAMGKRQMVSYSVGW